MRLHMLFSTIACAALLGAAPQNLFAAEAQNTPQDMDITKAAEASFQKMDTNKDGSVSKEEFMKAHPGMTDGAFNALDTDKSGGIDKDEWTKFMHSHSMSMRQSGHPATDGQEQKAPDMPMVMPPAAK